MLVTPRVPKLGLRTTTTSREAGGSAVVWSTVAMVITMTAPAQDVSFARRHVGWTITFGRVVIGAVLFEWNWFRP